MKTSTTLKTALLLTLISAFLMLAMTGCGASQSYKIGVRVGYPAVADRLDNTLHVGGPEAKALRDAATDPITYPKASAAWTAAAPLYREAVKAGAFTPHRRADWLETADRLDALNADEALHETPLFTVPTTQPAK